MSNINCRHDMLRASYTFRGNAACKGCGAPIEWWRTNNGKMTPFDPIENDTIQTVPHWATCPKRNDFKSKAEKATDARTAREKGVSALLETTGARAVIALYDDGVNFLSWRNGIPAEDLKHEAITAANRLRHEIVMNGGKA